MVRDVFQTVGIKRVEMIVVAEAAEAALALLSVTKTHIHASPQAHPHHHQARTQAHRSMQITAHQDARLVRATTSH